MAVTILPKTQMGKWGFGITIGFVVLFVLKVLLSLPVPSFLIFGIGIWGIALNVWAVIRKERGILFFVVGGLVAAFVLFWIGGELLFPH